MTCAVVDGDPPFTFKWIKDGNTLQNNKEYFIADVGEYISTLTIPKLGAQSNGNYTCRVENAFGSDEKSDALLIKGNKLFDILYLNFN